MRQSNASIGGIHVEYVAGLTSSTVCKFILPVWRVSDLIFVDEMTDTCDCF